MMKVLEALAMQDFKKRWSALNDKNKNNEDSNENNDQNNPSKTESDASALDLQQTISMEESEEIGEESSQDEIEYFPKIESNSEIENYKFYTNEYDEIVKADELCDLKELDRLRLSLDQQVFSFKPLIAKIANRLQRRLQAQQNRQWEFNLEEGYLDSSRLAKIIAKDSEGLQMISACCAGSEVNVDEIKYLQKTQTKK